MRRGERLLPDYGKLLSPTTVFWYLCRTRYVDKYGAIVPESVHRWRFEHAFGRATKTVEFKQITAIVSRLTPPPHARTRFVGSK